MKVEQVEIFVYGNGKPQVVEAALTETLRDVLSRIDALPDADGFVFVGECIEAIDHPEAGADMHEAVSIELSIEELELHKHKHVHVGATHRVEVVVRFNGDEKHRHFSPASTIATVTAWAKNRFGIAPGDGGDLVLQLLPHKTQPRPEVHLGELLKPGEHKLEFEMIREVTPVG
jgi:hypothetical protein